MELVASPFSGCQICSKVFFNGSSPGNFWCFNSKKFLSYSKKQLVIYASQFMIQQSFNFQLLLWILKFGTVSRKINIIWRLPKAKQCIKWNKKHFSYFSKGFSNNFFKEFFWFLRSLLSASKRLLTLSFFFANQSGMYPLFRGMEKLKLK